MMRNYSGLWQQTNWSILRKPISSYLKYRSSLQSQLLDTATVWLHIYDHKLHILHCQYTGHHLSSNWLHWNWSWFNVYKIKCLSKTQCILYSSFCRSLLWRQQLFWGTRRNNCSFNAKYCWQLTHSSFTVITAALPQRSHSQHPISASESLNLKLPQTSLTQAHYKTAANNQTILI